MQRRGVQKISSDLTFNWSLGTEPPDLMPAPAHMIDLVSDRVKTQFELDGIRGLQFFPACVKSSKVNSEWRFWMLVTPSLYKSLCFQEVYRFDDPSSRYVWFKNPCVDGLDAECSDVYIGTTLNVTFYTERVLASIKTVKAKGCRATPIQSYVTSDLADAYPICQNAIFKTLRDSTELDAIIGL